MAQNPEQAGGAAANPNPERGQLRAPRRRKSQAAAVTKVATAAEAARSPSVSSRARAYRWHFGCHNFYGNGLPRPQMRGWLHTACVIIGMSRLLTTPGAAALGGEAVVDRWFVGFTLIGYMGSVNFHMVPYSTAQQYNWALAADFLGVSVGMLAPVVTLAATGNNEVLPQAATDGTAVLVGAACVGLLAAMLGSSLSDNRAVIDEYRGPRLAVMACVLLLQTAIECSCCIKQPDTLALWAAVMTLKIASPVYQLKLGSHTALAKHGLRARWLTVPGTWEHHENFHLGSLVCHALQWQLLRRLVGGA